MNRLNAVLNGFTRLDIMDVATGTGAFLNQIIRIITSTSWTAIK